MDFVRSGLPHKWPVITGGIYARENCQTIRGRINGEIAFECRDVLPPSSITQRSDGSSVVMLQSGCMDLISEKVDEISSRRIHELLGLGGSTYCGFTNNVFRANCARGDKRLRHSERKPGRSGSKTTHSSLRSSKDVSFAQII
jgi:hypothetical protein